jgi:MraZ protein
MFLGHYEHTIDEKGRMIIPIRYREMLEGGAFIMTGFDGELMVMPSGYFTKISEKINALSLTDASTRLLQMMIFQNADHLEVDRSGRILIPQFLRDNSKLEDTVIITGAGQYFAIWSPEAWAKKAELLQDPEFTSQRFAALTI